MGSRLPIIFGALVVARFASAQPGPLPAADLARQGNDHYSAGKYADAAALYRRALDLEPNSVEYKFKLAQSLRQSGDCDQALPIYRAIEGTAPADQKSEIDAGIAQCSPTITQPAPIPDPPEPITQPMPQPASGGGGSVTTRTAMMAMGGGALFGAGVILLWAGYTHKGDAEAARSVSDYNRISGRATTEYVLGAVGIAAGVTLGALALYRITASKKETDTAVAFTPEQGGGTLVLGGSW